jgi:hypothetical protein
MRLSSISASTASAREDGRQRPYVFRAMSAFTRVAALGVPLMLAACNDSGVGYVEIKTLSAAPALYLDTVKLEPLRNGTGVLRQKVGTTKLQVDDGGQLALLCNIVVQKNRITTVTVSGVSRQPRCQCGRNSTEADTPPNRTCVA